MTWLVIRYLALSLLALSLLLAGGCNTGPRTSDRDVQIIDLTELDQLQQDPRVTVVVVDPRPAARFERGHLPGAINIPLDRIRAGDERLARAQVVVYGQNYRDPISPAAAKKLIGLGYANVLDYRGGVEGWEAEGRQVLRADGSDTATRSDG
jgi:rhodanese-related sulfurtransferase